MEDPYLLRCRYGSFVSLHKGSDLRGCIGTCSPTGSLYDTVFEMTQAAAARDHRFSPVTADEVDEVRIELSILSQLTPVIEIQTLKTGLHGLHISCAGQRGLFLPQVAVQYRWDVETYLGQVCLKAGLSQKAWRSPGARMSCFTALIIGEEP